MLEQQEQQEEDDEDNEEGEEGSGEAQGSSSSAAVQAVADGIQDLGLEDDYFFSGGDETLRGWERENVSRALVALGHAGDLLKAVLGAVDEATQGPEAGGQMVMQTIARMEESCQVLTAAVVNAADACYPPQVRIDFLLVCPRYLPQMKLPPILIAPIIHSPAAPTRAGLTIRCTSGSCHRCSHHYPRFTSRSGCCLMPGRGREGETGSCCGVAA